ncbi:hypothetical protein I79_001091 [Cricetulus griseus]|uniref:Uncharacterized protein n=1 Tax=Cricetulus griseus TaxID=10029 RepID=G3GTV2_CRIGR|nr:hypothetical protein I79_001091 [Cricetulus griseus]
MHPYRVSSELDILSPVYPNPRSLLALEVTELKGISMTKACHLCVGKCHRKAQSL